METPRIAINSFVLLPRSSRNWLPFSPVPSQSFGRHLVEGLQKLHQLLRWNCSKGEGTQVSKKPFKPCLLHTSMGARDVSLSELDLPRGQVACQGDQCQSVHRWQHLITKQLAHGLSSLLPVKCSLWCLAHGKCPNHQQTVVPSRAPVGATCMSSALGDQVSSFRKPEPF